MNGKAVWISATAGLGLLLYWAYKEHEKTLWGDVPIPEEWTQPSALNTMDKIIQKAASVTGTWHPPEQYAGAIAQAEQAHGLPVDMLARLLYQESRYSADIISGAKRSPVGALGIAQFMPATAAEMGIDPLDPFQAIPAAARYMRQLFQRFGNWSEALAAYNWGMGNVSRKGLAKAPEETRNYYSQILADVNDYHGTAYA